MAFVEIEPFLAARALVTCFKPADDPSSGRAIVHLWETSGQGSPVLVRAPAFRHARATDLLERKGALLQVKENTVAVPVRGFGFAGVALQE